MIRDISWIDQINGKFMGVIPLLKKEKNKNRKPKIQEKLKSRKKTNRICVAFGSVDPLHVFLPFCF